MLIRLPSFQPTPSGAVISSAGILNIRAQKAEERHVANGFAAKGNENAMDGANAYALLGLDRSASPEALTRAFRAAAKRCHPDHGGDRREFEALWAAYQFVRAQPARRPNPFAAPIVPQATFDAYDATRRRTRRLSFAEELANAMAA
jgi:hypothetical protein